MKAFFILFMSGMTLLLLALAQSMSLAAAGRAAPVATSTPIIGPATEALPAGAVIQTVLPGLNGPIAMAFDPGGRLFFNEKATGLVRLVINDVLQASPVITFNVDSCSERGLLGIAIDPSFTSNHYIYVYYTANPGTACGATENRVARFVENNGVGMNPTTIFTSTQTAGNHNGGNIHFGPDGKLYISIGENANPANSQDVTVKNGKIHRINPDGSIPSGNPVFTQTGALPSLFAMGLRNSFDFTFDPLSSYIFASENGPSCDDEMNRIVGGNNYGWRPGYPCDDNEPSPTYNTIRPLWFVPDTQCCIAPTGIEVYHGTSVPQWQNNLFMCSYNDGVLRHFYLNGNRTLVTAAPQVLGVTCNMDIATGPDGAFYYFEGGGYSTGILKRIVGTGPTVTPTPTRTPVGPTITPGGPTPCPIQFTDVNPTDPFYAYIRCLACRNILSGYSTSPPCALGGVPCFNGGNSITRGQVAKIVANAAGYSDAIPSTQQTFTDVPYSNAFWLYIERAVQHGVISGYSTSPPCTTGTPCFLPGTAVTRGQLAKIDASAAGYNDAIPSTQQTFTDVPYGSPFWVYVERAVLHAVLSGYSTSPPCPGPVPCFLPGNSVTRNQTAKIVANTFYPSCLTPAR